MDAHSQCGFASKHGIFAACRGVSVALLWIFFALNLQAFC